MDGGEGGVKQRGPLKAISTAQEVYKGLSQLTSVVDIAGSLWMVKLG